MSTFNVIINGNEMIATGNMIGDVSTTGKPFTVVLVDSLLKDGKDGKPFLKLKDQSLRTTELSDKQVKLDAAWAKALEAYKAENPNADASGIEAYKQYWMTTSSARQFTSNLTSGLTATIVDADGVAHSAYFMREATKDAPRFRTYSPKVETVLADCPF